MTEIQQRIIDAFDQGYCIHTTNELEKIIFLTECYKMGLHWQSGHLCTDYLPYFNDIHFIRNPHGTLRFSYLRDEEEEEAGAMKTKDWAEISGAWPEAALAFNY